jgi:Spy/CpxP family protein refolding chaperone
MKNWKAILSVVAVFLLGVAAGGLVTASLIHRRVQHMGHGGPRGMEEAIVRRMSRRLELDKAQQEQLRVIVHESQREMEPVRKQMEEVLARAQTKIRGILTSDQAAKFDKFVTEGRARWRPSTERAPDAPAERK